ncbi:MAG TPA: ATP-binding cassette domain-containing protein [Anaerolineales bacterium]|nr:ATP-binding cassette domain-containing protein [Anaerolineales bacterium]
MYVLETKALTRRFGGLTAVDAIDITVQEGEIFGLLGPNGAGKSTALKMLTTLLPPTSGIATVAGFDIVHQAASVRRVIGYVPQLLSADGALTGYENLLMFSKLYDIPKAERETRIEQSLELVQLGNAAGKLVNTYSGGMIRRLEIAQSMLHRPAVLFLDEPTVGLDPLARNSVWEHIQQLKSRYGTTIVLTTHYMEEADVLCNRVAIMHQGKLATIGSPMELKASLGGDATLDDVFAHFAGAELESGGSYREVSRTRRTARRVG